MSSNMCRVAQHSGAGEPGRHGFTRSQDLQNLGNMGKEKYAVVVLILGLALSAFGQPSQKPAFDIEKEVRAYLDRTPPEKKAQSDAYFEGGYWLQLWGFIASAA